MEPCRRPYRTPPRYAVISGNHHHSYLRRSKMHHVRDDHGSSDLPGFRYLRPMQSGCSICQGHVRFQGSRKGSGLMDFGYHCRSFHRSLCIRVRVVARNPSSANDPRRFIAHHTQWNWIVWTESIILASLFIFELCFLPESLVNKPCYRDVLGFRDIFFQLPRKKEAEDALLASVHEQKAGADLNSSKQTLLCLLYPAIWLAGLAFAVPYGCESPISFIHPVLIIRQIYL